MINNNWVITHSSDTIIGERFSLVFTCKSHKGMVGYSNYYLTSNKNWSIINIGIASVDSPQLNFKNK